MLTERARAEAARQVGELGPPVAAVAREFGVGWDTVMRAVTDTAARLFADQHLYTLQGRPCVAIGVDEKVMNRASRGRHRRFVTVIVDLARRRPLDIIEGRSKKVLRAWWRPRPQPGGPVNMSRPSGLRQVASRGTGHPVLNV